MTLEEKSLEELEACEAAISKERRKKENEKILSEGGFICLKCGRVFPKDKESKEFPGYCSQDAYPLRIEKIRKVFENLEKDNQQIELVRIKFARDSWSQKESKPINLSSTGMTNEAVVSGLVLKIGDQYVELSQTTPFDSDDEVLPTLILRGTNPPKRRENGSCYFPSGEE